MDTQLAVKNIMIKNVVVADPDTTVKEAAQLMASRNVDSVIVLDPGKKPVGIVTHGDIVRKVVLEDKNPNSVRVKEIMTSPLVTTTPAEDLNRVAKKMYRRGIRKMPVIENDALVGIIADVDIIATCTQMSTILTDLIEMNSDITYLQQGCPVEGVDEDSIRQGICEKCGTFSSNLRPAGGMMVCETCSEEMRE